MHCVATAHVDYRFSASEEVFLADRTIHVKTLWHAAMAHAGLHAHACVASVAMKIFIPPLNPMPAKTPYTAVVNGSTAGK
jgi:diphthamide biosynthesis methyltransferase